MISRRGFLGSASAVVASRLFGAPDAASNRPSAELEKLADAALRRAKQLGASYCDIRINRYRDQEVGVRISRDPSTGKDLEVPFSSDTGTFGFGVRVIADGAWGFAASPDVNADEIARIAAAAVSVARASAKLKGPPVELAPVAAYHDRW